MSYGADGPYVSGVNLFIASAIMCIMASAPSGAAVPPGALMRDLSATPVSYTKHTHAENMCVFAFRETAAKSALNRALDPFMLINTMKTSGANGSSSVSDVFKRCSQHFLPSHTFKSRARHMGGSVTSCVRRPCQYTIRGA